MFKKGFQKIAAKKVVLIILLAVFCLSPCFAEDTSSKSELPSYKIGAIPKKAIFQMRDHNTALYYWMSAYADKLIPGGLTLIHVDKHADDLCGCYKNEAKAKKSLDEFMQLKSDQRKAKFDSFCKGGEFIEKIQIDSFIIPAMKMGIIERFIWITPNYLFFDKNGPYRKQPYFIYMLTAKQLKDMDYCNRSAEFDFEEGCDISTFEVETFPAQDGPVLLDIDMDTFGDKRTESYCNLPFSLEQIDTMVDELFTILNKNYPNVYLTTIAFSPKEFSTKRALMKLPLIKSKLTGKTVNK